MTQPKFREKNSQSRGFDEGRILVRQIHYFRKCYGLGNDQVARYLGVHPTTFYTIQQKATDVPRLKEFLRQLSVLGQLKDRLSELRDLISDENLVPSEIYTLARSNATEYRASRIISLLSGKLSEPTRDECERDLELAERLTRLIRRKVEWTIESTRDVYGLGWYIKCYGRPEKWYAYDELLRKPVPDQSLKMFLKKADR